MPVRLTSTKSFNVIILSMILLFSSLFMPGSLTTGLQYKGGDTAYYVTSNMMGNLTSIGDLNKDGNLDLALLLPHNSSIAPNGGSVHIFLGTAGGFPVFQPQNADITFTGMEDHLLGSNIVAWDHKSNTWPEITLGCPGAGNGTVFIFDSVLVNGAPKGTVLDTDQAYIQLTEPDVFGFGSHLQIGEFTGIGQEDLVVLSQKNSTLDPKMTLYPGGVSPIQGTQFDISPLSITPYTNVAAMDLMGKGKDALIYSSPDRAVVRINYFDINDTYIQIPGANTSGIVDFQGSIVSSGNTYGWGNGDDGWDTSPSHIFDSDSGIDSVRFNQDTGNIGNYNRSVENVGRLDIEIGGTPSSSGGEAESGAYGVTFQILSGDLVDKDSVILGFDHRYENWGFELDERLWIKSRLTDTTGSDHWIGEDLDSSSPTDSSPEVWSQKGRNSGGSGMDQSGESHFETEISSILTGPGEYYLELGGKVSRWTAAGERAAMGFDNISIKARSLEVTQKKITGAYGIGTSILSADVNNDGLEDLILGNPSGNKVRIFFGGDPFWDGETSINSDWDNVTIETDDGEFGTSMMVVGTSDFMVSPSLFISSPSKENDYHPWQSGEGAVVRLETPLSGDLIDPWETGYSIPAPNGSFSFGSNLISIGDLDDDGNPQYLITGFDVNEKLIVHEYDRGASFPSLSIDSPSREFKLQGIVVISATTSDIDLDVDPWDIMFYLAIDNKSWAPIGNGTPDRVIGNQAFKDWNTTNAENRVYFLKVEVTDSFGLTTERYSNSVEVHNHEPPIVLLNYPSDGTIIKGNEEITARVLISSKEELDPPISFMYSRDNETWIEFATSSEPKQGSDVDHATILNTETLDDGEIWFKVNASIIYGLGTEDRNIVPCYIDNAYEPEIEFLGNYTGNITGVINVTARVFDRDGDLVSPVELSYRDPVDFAWESFGNMTGPIENDTYFMEIDTTTLENGPYQIKVSASDLTFNEVESILNVTLDIHNLYIPVLSFISIEEGSTLSGISRLQVSVVDTDANYEPNSMKIFYRDPEVGFWNPIPQVLINGGVATVDWDTKTVLNGIYDLRAEIIDNDNLSAFVEVYGVIVKNVVKPQIVGDLNALNGPLSGSIRITFNITDDQEIPVRNIRVEVFIFDHWEEIPGLKREIPNLTFTPNTPIGFIVDWDTNAVDDLGGRMYPDGPGYQIRVSVLDPDGEEDILESIVSYKIDNTKFVPDNRTDTSDSGLDPGMIAILVLVGLVVLVLLIVGFFVIISRRSEKRGSIPAAEGMKPKREDKPVESEPDEAPQDLYPQDRTSDIYSPSGWGSTPAPEAPMTGYDDDIPLFTADSDDLFTSPSILDEPPAKDDTFRSSGKKKKARKGILDDIEVDVDLPEGAMPVTSGMEEEEDWEDVDDWSDDEEDDEWEELDEFDDDEDWDEEEDEWEDVEDEPEEILVITCKCEEEIEIPSSFSGNRFKCPSCGRTGKLRK